MLKRVVTIFIITMTILLTITICAQAEETLLSGNKRVWANSEESPNPAVNIVDGDYSKRWAAEESGYNKYVVIDLGATYSLTKIKIFPKEGRVYQYSIAGSYNGDTFENISTEWGYLADGYYLKDLDVTYRYIKVEILDEENNKWTSLDEIEIYGDNTMLGLVNCSLGKNVQANAEQADEGNYAANLTDGNVNTRWAADASNGEVRGAIIDLGELFYISRTELIPEGKRAYGYRIEGSYDGAAYTVIADMQENESAEVLKCNFAPIEVRYVRLVVTSMPVNVSWVNIKEFSVFGQKYGCDISSEENTPLKIEGDSEMATVTLSGTSAAVSGRVMTLIIAVYKNDKMIGYKAETDFIPTYGEIIEKTIQITSADIGVNLEGKVVEAFVWDNLDNMKTIISPVKTTIAATE